MTRRGGPGSSVLLVGSGVWGQVTGRGSATRRVNALSRWVAQGQASEMRSRVCRARCG